MSDEIKQLKGETIKSILGLEKHSPEVHIYTESGKIFNLYHAQDCCETVELYDFDIEPNELDGALVTDAYLETNQDDSSELERGFDCFTWSFYRIVTNKGTLCMRWLGESNGYYSESVDLTISYTTIDNSNGDLK